MRPTAGQRAESERTLTPKWHFGRGSGNPAEEEGQDPCELAETEAALTGLAQI